MSAIEVDLPDSIRSYMNEIAERLWAERAAVMVGSGFSKNAGDGFPDWNQLGDLFYQKAHGVKPEPTKQKYLNVLRLAEEVQAATGRPALENLLRSNIPDLSIEPSDLHVELLELPWVDVFTTNYDTLLERASAKVVTRRYEPVVNKGDLPYAIKPRIVKLHGSFPSERPFIITEEDYRLYPAKYAPFVNTVQQALLENTFCLIGFSGDDPNFLRWIGWIRDNLGRKNTQKIYLVGVFDLSSARLQLLAQRGIIVVDLSCCAGIEKHDHSKALRRFFEYILSQKPDALDWPYNPKKMHPTHGADRTSEIQKITEEWRKQRQAYPCWLILPHGNREGLWAYTNSWVNYLPDTEEGPLGLDLQYTFELVWRLEKCLLPVFNNIGEFCEELLQKYWPFQNETPPANCQIHPGKNNFQDLPWDDLRQAWLAIAVAMLRLYREEGDLDKWQETESLLKTLFDHLSAEQKEFLNYEGFLFSLFNLDIPDAKQRLESWRPNEAQPYWMTKRAAALAEIGCLNDTYEKIRWSLVESREKSNNDAPSCYMWLSNESFQMLLLRYIGDAGDLIVDRPATPEEEQKIKDSMDNEWKQSEQHVESERQIRSTIKPQEKFNTFNEAWDDLYNNRFTSRRTEWGQHLSIIRNNQRRNELQQQNTRWDELKAFRCDPWNEIKLYELKLNRPPVKQKNITQNREFEIGLVSTTYHSHGIDKETLNAYSFLRFCEDVGLPYRIGSYTMATKTAMASLQRIARLSPFWAIATLARTGDVKAVNSLFSRESVYRFTENQANKLINDYLVALNKSRDEIHVGNAFRNNNFGVRLSQLLPEVISRFCCKCSDEAKNRILNFVTKIYASPDKANYRNVKNLLNRLISSMSEHEQYRLVPDLLKIPFPKDLTLLAEYDFLNPFLLIDINQKPDHTPALKLQPELVDDLFRQAALNNLDRRRWAITSLAKLHELQLLNESQTQKLAEAIWRVTDQHYGLPDSTDFYKFAFLKLPHPEGVVPVKLFKNYVKSTPFPIHQNNSNSGTHITDGNILIVHEIIGANGNGESIWTPEDAAEIFQRLLNWWDADKDRLTGEERYTEAFTRIAEEFQARFSRMVELLAEVVGPNLSFDSPEEIKIPYNRLLQEFREYGLPGLEAEAASIHIFPDQKSEIYNRINEALLWNQPNVQRDALKAIAKILLNKDYTFENAVDFDATSMLSQYLTWCPTNSIHLALWIIIRILNNSSAVFLKNLETATLRRLDRLLTNTAYDNDNSELNFDEKLEVRRISSILASALWTYYSSQGLPLPDIIERWRAACLSPDEFSEIRNPWKDR